MAKRKLKSKSKDATDERIGALQSNPVFHEMPQGSKKVRLDSRFSKLFTDERFASTSAKLDRRGRPLTKTAQDELKSVYEVDSDTEEQKDEGHVSSRVDLARGEGQVESSSEDDSSTDEDGDDEELDAQDKWGELDSDVKRVEWSSSRLAICNLDWDKIRAEDIYMALQSFKPTSGEIKSVTVFLSEYGTKQLAAEDSKGPQLSIEDCDAGRSKNDAVRAYQLDRLKYYYAVAECNSEATAKAIYESCDGVEFESSGVKFDLRFIPDDMDFEESNVRERCLAEEFNSKKFKPKYFQTAAVTRSNVNIDWDTNEYERQKLVQRAFEPTADLDECSALLAPASDDDEEDEAEFGKSTQLLFEAAGISQRKATDRADDWTNSKDCTLDKEESEASPQKKLTAFQEKMARRKEKLRAKKALLREQRNALRSGGTESSKAKGKKKSTTSTQQVDEADSRFSALFTNSEFAIDRTHSQFKGGALADKQVARKSAKSKHS